MKAYLATVYTKIIPKHWKNFYYIDLLADSGICKTKDRVVLGSALLAAIYANTPFTKMFFVDSNKTSLAALEKRMARLKQQPNYADLKYAVLPPEDCNTAIDKILSELPPNSHYLAFVDCESMEVEWLTIKKLLSRQGDLIINFQSCGAARAVKAPQCNIPDSKIAKFFGVNVDEIKKGSLSREGLLDLYMENIRHSGRDLCFSIRIDSGEGSFFYDLVFASRLTRAGSPWSKAVLDLKRKVEHLNCKMIGTAFSLVRLL